METHLRGKKVLITAASRGLGKGFAEGFAQEGCEVIINEPVGRKNTESCGGASAEISEC